jgi:hypothetical protein
MVYERVDGDTTCAMNDWKPVGLGIWRMKVEIHFVMADSLDPQLQVRKTPLDPALDLLQVVVDGPNIDGRHV